MALTAAVCAGALAVAVLLFFEVWWAGLIALAVSMLCGVATVLLFMAYQADRRRNLRITEEEQEEQRIMTLFDEARSQRGKATDDVEPRTDLQESEAKTATVVEMTAEEKLSAGKKEVAGAGEERLRTNEDGESKPSTLEMRPPLKIFTVEEAKSRMNGGAIRSDDNAQDDKNDG